LIILNSLRIDQEAYPQKNIQRLEDGQQIIVDREYNQEVHLRRDMYKADAMHIYATTKKRNSRKDELSAAKLISRSLAKQYPDSFTFEKEVFTNLKKQENIHFDKLKTSPLEKIAQHIQEDIIIVRKDSSGEYAIKSGFLAFPSNWYIHDFLGAPMSSIHNGLGKNGDLSRVINNILDKISVDTPLRRNNWFINDDPTQAQTLNHYGKSDFIYSPITAKNILERLYFRSEYQTLSKLDTGAVMFSIKIQTFRLKDVITQPNLADRLLRGIVLKQESQAEVLPTYYKQLIIKLAKYSNEYHRQITYKKIWQQVKSDIEALL